MEAIKQSYAFSEHSFTTSHLTKQNYPFPIKQDNTNTPLQKNRTLWLHYLAVKRKAHYVEPHTFHQPPDQTEVSTCPYQNLRRPCVSLYLSAPLTCPASRERHALTVTPSQLCFIIWVRMSLTQVFPFQKPDYSKHQLFYPDKPKFTICLPFPI